MVTTANIERAPKLALAEPFADARGIPFELEPQKALALEVPIELLLHDHSEFGRTCVEAETLVATNPATSCGVLARNGTSKSAYLFMVVLLGAASRESRLDEASVMVRLSRTTVKVIQVIQVLCH